ncbi:aminotransferase class I/II-fold pyridoxal phosphate-dependent enzyme [Thalassobacillus devorans]|uniref:aminotransferase class I/II-fold pyridoxal phosphate-dependent enzyme n=1 Tax=Thalassobacillus devorans TaxID=279813 RepID=UPI000A1CA254|nr:aminotransferase class I/II-fold pyridoxal phosphate-dependent enzyme [Thalassobacillus devorans]
MNFQSEAVSSIPPYLFSKINQRKKELIEHGMDVIDLGIGAPDLPTPPHIVDKLKEEMEDPLNFKYSPYGGCSEFREAVATFYEREFSVRLDSEKEVLTLIGSKEGIGHLLPAVMNPGDHFLVPDPGYPVYESASVLARIKTIPFPLKEENRFVLDFNDIPVEKANQAKAMILNYPGNPTSATVTLEFFQRAADFAEKYDLLLIHDSAYNMITFKDYEAPSLLQADINRERVVEFGSLSKSYCMTGWRIGYAVGSQAALNSLCVIKSNLDTSQFLPIQKAAAYALSGDQSFMKEYNTIFENRMLIMYNALQEAGIEASKPNGSIFLWCKVPLRLTSKEFAEQLLEQTGVIITPGSAFGLQGEGFFRVSLSSGEDRLQEAAKRIANFIRTPIRRDLI